MSANIIRPARWRPPDKPKAALENAALGKTIGPASLIYGEDTTHRHHASSVTIAAGDWPGWRVTSSGHPAIYTGLRSAALREAGRRL